MVWQPEVDELGYRHELAQQMGGEEAVARQHAHGKLTARERIAALADVESFREVGSLAGRAVYDGDKITEFTPSNNIIGVCEVGGRKVVISADDFTIRGGSAAGATGNKVYFYVVDLALAWRLPHVRLLDATGGSVSSFEQIGRTYIPGWPGTRSPSELLCTVPVVSAAMGSIAGGPAIDACLAHFNLMVKGTSQLFPGGPPVVKAALGYEIHKEQLGGHEVALTSGMIDNLAETEEDAFEQIRRFLGYMPTSVWEMPPRVVTTDDRNRRDEELLSIIPRERTRPYDARKVLKHVLDRDSFFEIAPLYGKSRITGLARVDGYPVGVMINNPQHLGGSLDVAAGDKICRFLQMCDTFHLPLVYFCDEPGFMVGLEEQKRGVVRAGARITCATIETRMPWISFVIRQAYGVAGSLHNRPGGLFARYAWPSGHWGSMHIEGGTSAAYRRQIEAAPDPDAERENIEQRLKALASPFRTAESFNIEEIIDPRDTRRMLCDFVDAAQGIIRTQLGPSAGPSYHP